MFKKKLFLSAFLLSLFLLFVFQQIGNPFTRGAVSADVNPTTVTFSPSHDSYVNADLATTNFGTSTSLFTDVGPARIMYFKFDLSSLAGKTITGATLRIKTTNTAGSATEQVQNIKLVEDTSWTESALTYNNRPTVSSTQLGGLTRADINTSYTVTLSSVVLQSKVGGSVSFAIVSGGSDVFRIHSKETTTGDADKPLLSVTYTDSTPTPTPAGTLAACTHTIDADDDLVDGEGNYSFVVPGDVLCFPAGTRGNLKLQNLHGIASAPITIRNTGGIAKITGTDLSTGGLAIYTSSYLHITGTGVSSQCGAEYAVADQQCGIEIYNAYKGISGPNTEVDHIEIDHISIHDIIGLAAAGPGIGIHPGNGGVLTDMTIHDNYIVDTYTEGLYIGSDPNKPIEENGTLDGVDIYNNYVKNTGFDGINVKQASDVSVHDNTVITSGTLNGFVDHVPEGGIQLAASEGDVYNNFVMDSRDTGIHMGRAVDGTASRYYNNIVIGSDAEGISTDETHAKVYNNTVVDNMTGMDVTGPSAELYDNIVVGSISSAIHKANNTDSFNNYTGSVASVSFRNSGVNDYRLTENSTVAIDKGRNSGLFPALDYNNVPRPQGRLTDLGAFEYVATSTHSSSQSSGTQTNSSTNWILSIDAGPHFTGQPQYIKATDGTNAMTYIDKGAIQHDIQVVITKKVPDDLRKSVPVIPFPWSRGYSTVGEIYDFSIYSSFNGYELFEFDKPVTIVLPYDPKKVKNISLKRLRIAYYDSKTRRWKVLPTTVVNAQEQTIATTTKVFSLFTVVY